MAIIKEYETHQIEMRGPENPNAKPMEVGTTIILRHDDKKPLNLKKLAALFNAAADDYPTLDHSKISVREDHITFKAKPAPGYTRLPNRSIGARG